MSEAPFCHPCAESRGHWLSLGCEGLRGVGAKWGRAHLHRGCTYKDGRDAQAACRSVLLWGLGGETTPLVQAPWWPWLVAPLRQRGAAGAGKMELSSEGRGDPGTPAIGKTSVTAWKVIFAT